MKLLSRTVTHRILELFRMDGIEKPACLYYGKRSQISQKNCYYVTIEKVYEVTVIDCNIIMMS